MWQEFQYQYPKQVDFQTLRKDSAHNRLINARIADYATAFLSKKQEINTFSELDPWAVRLPKGPKIEDKDYFAMLQKKRNNRLKN